MMRDQRRCFKKDKGSKQKISQDKVCPNFKNKNGRISVVVAVPLAVALKWIHL